MGVFSPLKSTAFSKSELNMSTKDETADEREEGEIIDEFEDIISSDEEFSMRQRIEELEAKNAELEKIANISGLYASGNYDYIKKDSSSHLDRYPLISIDISDDEEYPPAPPMSRLGKRRKSLQHSGSRRKIIHSSSNSHRRRKKSSSPPPAPQYRPSDKLLLSMFHDRVAGHSSHSSKRKKRAKKSHSAKSSHRKSREYYVSDSDGDYNFDAYNVDPEDSYENFNNSDGNRSFSINREELRVALARNTHRNEQHVSLKDRLIRRKENTDTLNEKSTPDPQEINVVEDNKPIGYEDKEETEDNLEEQELRIIALKSAVIRKHLVRQKRNENVAYSPSDFDEIYANMAESPSINNIDDTEACNSMEISPVPSPKMILTDDEGMDTKPVDMDIVNSDSDCELPSYEKWVPIEQIPLPNSLGIDRGELYAPTPLRYNDRDDMNLIPPEVRFESASVSPGNLDSEVEEEELALRALLLAKMNSPKVNKIVKEERPIVVERQTPDPDISLEAETLRNFLINNMKKKTEPHHSSASVLKEAVRRLTARNSSPAESFTEIKPIVKTVEETEMELGQAITDMARVKIGVERDMEPNLGDRGNVEPKQIVKRKVSEYSNELEPKRIPKIENSIDRRNGEPKVVAKREISEDTTCVEPKKIVKRAGDACDVEHEKIVNRKLLGDSCDVKPKEIVKRKDLQERSDLPTKIVKADILECRNKTKSESEPGKEVIQGADNVEPEVDRRKEVVEGGSDIESKLGVTKEVVQGEVEKKSEGADVVNDNIVDRLVPEDSQVARDEVNSGKIKEIKGTVGCDAETNQVITVKMEDITNDEISEIISVEEVLISEILEEAEVDCSAICGTEVALKESLVAECLSVENAIAQELPTEKKGVDISTEEAEKEINVSEPPTITITIGDPSKKKGLEPIPTEVAEKEKNVCEEPTTVTMAQEKNPQEILTTGSTQHFGEKETTSNSENDSRTGKDDDKKKETSGTPVKKIKAEELPKTRPKSVVKPIKSSSEKKNVDPVAKAPESVKQMPKTNGESVPQSESVEVSVLDEKKKCAVRPSEGKLVPPTEHQKAVEIRAKAIQQAVPKVLKQKNTTTISATQQTMIKTEKPVNVKLVPLRKKPLPTAPAIQKPVAKVSTQPTTTRTKIVKPNKVINQPTTDLKRKSVDNLAKTSTAMKKLKTEEVTNRLITAAEMPQVKKLIIQLRESDSESEYSTVSAGEYDEYDGEGSHISSFLNRSITIGNEYYDIASPISLPMESPCDTPTRAGSPAVTVALTPQPIVEKSIVNDFFQAKLDQYLKNYRSKVANSVKKPVADDVAVVAPVINTPVAVRHLPEASQQEYRRLINRMKMLERQKQAKGLKVIVNTSNGANIAAAESRTVVAEVDNNTLVKKVLVKNASGNTAKPTCDSQKIVRPLIKPAPQKPKTPLKAQSIQQNPTKSVQIPRKATPSPQKSVIIPQTAALSPSKSVSTAKPSKENLLGLYENSYRKTGMSIISNLDKSIELVMVAKEAKMAKLKHEHRLRELQKEMLAVERSMQKQQERIAEIYPQICSSHEMIESLKTRRGKINKAVTALGRSVIGPNYSMNNEQKSIISEKSKKLAAEIKLVNNMKLSDVEKWEKENRQSSSDDGSAVAAPKDLNSCITIEPPPAVKSEQDTLLSSKTNMPVGDNESPYTTTAIVGLSMPEDTQNEPDSNKTIVPEALTNKEDPNDSTNGHEEALEIEPVCDKQPHDPENVGATNEDENEPVGGAKLQDYVSPLSHLRDERQINPNGIVCPYQLMGQCDDKDCKYMHLDE